MESEGPVTGAVGAFGQLEACRLGQAQLDTHDLVHPVVGCELGAVSSLGFGVGAVIAVVGPGDGLQTGAQLAVVAGQVHTNELAVAAHIVATLDGDDQAVSGLLTFFSHAGTGALVGSGEGVAVAGLGGVLQAVGLVIHSSGQSVGRQLVLSIAAHQLAAVAYGSVLGAEVGEVSVCHADRHILDAGDFIVVHLDGGAIGLGDGAAVPAVGGAVRGVEGLAVIGPVRHGVGAAVLCIDGSYLLEAAAVQAVVSGSTGHGIKSAQIVFAMAVLLCGRSSAASGIYVLVCPVLVPVQSGVQIGVVGAGHLVEELLHCSNAVLGIIGGSCQCSGGHDAQSHGCGKRQSGDLFQSHRKRHSFQISTVPLRKQFVSRY